LEKAKRGNVNLILALGSLATSAAAKATTDIPIIAGLILNVGDIEAGANLTGVGLEFPLEVQFQWLSRLLPGCKKVGVLYNPAQNLKKIESATRIAESMGLKLYAQKVESPSDIPYALESLSNKVDALCGVIDDLVYTPQTSKQILLFSFRHKIPFIGISGEWVKAGAFYALVCDYRDLGTQCGEKALKVLQGAHSSSSPLECPRKVACALNLKTAEYMKIEIKEELIKSSQEVFK
jgi:putative ABC transport system substrate-binding protein